MAEETKGKKPKTKKKKGHGAPTLPGVEGPGTGKVNIPEINEQASVYQRIRDRRQKLTIDEVEAKDKLSEMMHAHVAEIGKDDNGVMRYITDEDKEVIVSPAGETLKVREYKDPGEPGEQE